MLSPFQKILSMSIHLSVSPMFSSRSSEVSVFPSCFSTGSKDHSALSSCFCKAGLQVHDSPTLENIPAYINDFQLAT